MSYDKLKYLDQRWVDKREFIITRDNRICCYCNNPSDILQVHHVYYLPNKDPWDYPDESLKTICKGCHSSERFWEIEYRKLIRYLVSECMYSYEHIFRFLSGLTEPLDISNESRCNLGALAAGRIESLEFTRNLFNNLIGAEVL